MLRRLPCTHPPYTRFPRGASALLLLLLAPAACGDGGPAGGSDGWVEVRDSADIRIVESRADVQIDDPPIEVSSEPIVRIGSVEAANPAEEFTSVRSTTRLSDGRIVVVDRQTAEIRWFDENGEHLVTRGGRGGGPSEFNSPSALLVLPEDTVLVEDRPSMRHVLFGPDTEFVRSDPLDMEAFLASGARGECLGALLPDRSMILCRPEPGHERTGPDPGPGHLRSFSRFVRVTRDLSSEVPLGLYGGIEQWGIERPGGGTYFVMHPFHSFTVLGTGGDPPRVAIALNPEYSIEIWTPEGELERIVRRPGAEHRPDAADLAEARDQLEEQGSGDPQLRNRALAAMDKPDLVPSIRRLVFGPDGELWVLRDPQSAPEGQTRYDVFDGEGGLIAEIDLPELTFVHEVGPDYLLAVQMNELQVPFVQLFEVRR